MRRQIIASLRRGSIRNATLESGLPRFAEIARGKSKISPPYDARERKKAETH
jgi:hypothetical protein